MRDLLDQVSQTDTFARHALGIALTILGGMPEIEALWPDPADVEDALAYCAAVALAVDDDDDRIQESSRVCAGGDRAALMRAKGDQRLVVVE